MKTILKSVVAGLFAMLLTLPGAIAQERPAFSQQELDQMLAPIALYPDSLLSQVLMAATYPLEVVQAARWSRANPHLKGQDAVRAVEAMDWDASVKSLVAFPQILHRMDEQLDWTERLGEAFVAQEKLVMDSIQGLRQRAEQAGNLRSNEQVRVTRQDGHTLIEPAYPQVVYVPYYNPAVVYGSWWWPAYPPVYWGPPPGYYAWPALVSGFLWGAGVAISQRLFFGHFDWHHRQVNVVNVVQQPSLQAVTITKPVRWQHDVVHRRNVPYRHAAPRQRFGQHPVVRGDDHTRPAARHEARTAHLETRSAPIQARSQFAPPQSRPERSAAQVRDRLPDRVARPEIQRPQFRVPESRPAAPAPRASLPSRPTTHSPVARAEAHRFPPAAQARAAPRQESSVGHRIEPRYPVHGNFATARPAASAPLHAPRISGSHATGGARAYGGGHPPAMSAGRGGGRS